MTAQEYHQGWTCPVKLRKQKSKKKFQGAYVWEQFKPCKSWEPLKLFPIWKALESDLSGFSFYGLNVLRGYMHLSFARIIIKKHGLLEDRSGSQGNNKSTSEKHPLCWMKSGKNHFRIMVTRCTWSPNGQDASFMKNSFYIGPFLTLKKECFFFLSSVKFI